MPPRKKPGRPQKPSPASQKKKNNPEASNRVTKPSSSNILDQKPVLNKKAKDSFTAQENLEDAIQRSVHTVLLRQFSSQLSELQHRIQDLEEAYARAVDSIENFGKAGHEQDFISKADGAFSEEIKKLKRATKKTLGRAKEAVDECTQEIKLLEREFGLF